jgi:hypothetical protein
VQPIEDVGGLAHRCGDDPRVKRPVAARHVSVEDSARIDAVFGVDGTAGFGTAPARKYWSSEEDVVPPSQIAAIGCLCCALMIAARAPT